MMFKFWQAFRWIVWFFNLVRNRKSSPGYSLEFIQKSWEDVRLSMVTTIIDYEESSDVVSNLIKFLRSSGTFELIKLGPEHGDGAYYVPSNLHFDRNISIGVGKNFEFELSLNPNTKIFLFDHTILVPENLPSNFKFYKIGVGHKNSLHLKTLNQIFEICYVENALRTLLKIDIEGDEYKIFDNFKYIQEVDVLVLEIHNLNRILDREFRAEFINFSNFLFENFVCVYSNGNNNTGVTAFNNFVLANTIELTLVSKKIVQKLEVSVRNYSVQNNLKAPILKPFYEYNK